MNIIANGADNGPQSPAEPENKRVMTVTASKGFKTFLETNNISIALTTYQSGRLIVVGGNRNAARLHFSELRLKRPMGLALQNASLAVATKGQIARFSNVLHGVRSEGTAVDALYVQKSTNSTSDVDTHDVAFGDDGTVYFVNTQFSCLCTPSETHSFKSIWKPPFITKLASEDRCHLNGLAMRDGKPAYVTICGMTDEKNKWKDERTGNGVVMAIDGNKVVCKGLTMPHSPRWHDGQLWLLNSGTGEIGTVNLKTNKFQPRIFLPGYLRGLAFSGRYAIVGLSKPRENSVFAGLPLQAEIERRGQEPVCGIYVIDTEKNSIEHTLLFEGVITELYDTAIMAGVSRPALTPPGDQQKQRIVTIESDDPRG